MGAFKENLAAFPFPANYRQAAPPVREGYEHLRRQLVRALNSELPVPDVLNALLPTLFHLRLRALSDEAFSYEALQSGAKAFHKKAEEMLLERTQLAPLAEAVLFAVRMYVKVMRAAESALPAPSLQRLPSLPRYDECVWMLERLPNGERLAHWLRASLTIEIGCLTLEIFYENKPPNVIVFHQNLPDNRPSAPALNKRSLLQLQAWATTVQEAGQTFGAAARQLGIWPKRNQSATQNDIHTSPEDVQAERQLAEIGWEDFAFFPS
ncbi:MAG: hypothetical protein RMJ33_06395 [Saprospiraceae bacterium]|nr:hypothetical protein [Saprospiraceae bacterium]MDW8229450.1 hypothetical protein [Saprospiraceae bacterium]